MTYMQHAHFHFLILLINNAGPDPDPDPDAAVAVQQAVSVSCLFSCWLLLLVVGRALSRALGLAQYILIPHPYPVVLCALSSSV